VFADVEVPDSTPAVESVMAAGRVPAEIEYVKGSVPPVAEMVWL